MLSMAGNPLFGHDRGRQPKPQAHRKRREIMEPHTAMRLGAMKKEGDADVCYVAGDDHEKKGYPPPSCPHAETWHC
jgi:hypothetical protein